MPGNLLINANQVNPMLPDYIDFLIKRFENPDEVRTFEKGRFELIKIGGMTIGRETSFTSVLGTIVGWWAINLMFRFTFSERKNTRMTERTSPVSKSTAPHYMLARL